MRHFIVFADQRIPVDTLSQVDIAKRLLRDAGIDRANVFELVAGELHSTGSHIVAAPRGDKEPS